MAAITDVNYRLDQIIKTHERSITSIKFSPINGHLFAASSADGKIHIFRETSNNSNNNTTSDQPKTEPDQSNAMNIDSPDNNNNHNHSNLNGSGSNNHNNSIGSSITNSGVSYSFVGSCSGMHDSGVSDIAWSTDSRYLVSGSDDKTCVIWDVESCSPLRQLRGHTSFISCVAFNAAGTLIASGSFDETLRIWDVKSAKMIQKINAHSDPITSVDFSADNKFIVSASLDGLCRVWDAQQGQCLKTLSTEKTPPVSCVKFSHNGKYILASYLDCTLRLWDFQSAKCLKVYSGHTNNNYCCFSVFSTTHKSAIIVSGSEDGHVWIWDVQSKRELSRLVHNSGEGQSESNSSTVNGSGNASTSKVVLAVATHPTRNIIVSGSMEPNPAINVFRSSSVKI